MADQLAGLQSVQQQLVQATNALWQAQVYFAGQVTSDCTAAGTSTVIATGSGYLVRMSVTVAGTAGLIHDTTTTGSCTATNAIVVTPATVGVHEIGMRFTNGLVVVPGAAQIVNVTYSLDGPNAR